MSETEQLPILHLRKGHTKPLMSGHPWVFAKAIEKSEGRKPIAADEVVVVDHRRQLLGCGFYSPESAIAVRLLSREDEPLDVDFLAKRIDAAIALRRDVLGLTPNSKTTNAFRLIHSEGDHLGGLIVDLYGDVLCVQFGTVGMFARQNEICRILAERLNPRLILDKSDPNNRRREGLPDVEPNTLLGENDQPELEVHEAGVRFNVNLDKVQKTGLFLDQRENRKAFGSYAKGRRVLDAFSYSGGFSLHAAQNGAASLTLMDASKPALNAAKTNLESNGVEDAELVAGDWRKGLRQLREAERRFNLMVLDPPKFAKHKAKKDAALQGYRDLNAQAAELLDSGSILFTCSCSGNVSEQDFERAVAAGIHSAGRRATVLERRGAAPDHPTPPGFDQGLYLKCLVLYVE